MKKIIFIMMLILASCNECVECTQKTKIVTNEHGKKVEVVAEPAKPKKRIKFVSENTDHSRFDAYIISVDDSSEFLVIRATECVSTTKIK